MEVYRTYCFDCKKEYTWVGYKTGIGKTKQQLEQMQNDNADWGFVIGPFAEKKHEILVRLRVKIQEMTDDELDSIALVFRRDPNKEFSALAARPIRSLLDELEANFQAKNKEGTKAFYEGKW